MDRFLQQSNVFKGIPVNALVSLFPKKFAKDEFSIQLMPSVNPDHVKDGIAHFFKEGASSTFIVRRNGKTITAYYFGRNEVPNIKDLPVVDAIRNKLVATSAMAGISSLQWTALLKGLLKKEL